MMQQPIEIARANAHDVRIVWKDGHEGVYPARFLRLHCPCAACIDEISGVRRLKDEDVAADVHPLRIAPVGRYGVAIAWSDGHSTGIYTFEQLRKICPCGACS